MSELILSTAVPRIMPPHNLYGDHGPLCPDCSGLGKVLRLGSEGAPTREASGCRPCRGSGVDRDAVMESTISAALLRISDLERKQAESARVIQSITRHNGKLSRQSWEELIAWATADGASVNTTAAETIIFPNVTIPANYMQDGRLLRLLVKGKHSTLGSGTVTVIFTLRWGGVAGTVLCKTGTVTQVISLTNALFSLAIDIQTRSNGSSGTIMANGDAAVYGATAPTIGSATGAPAVAPMTNGGQTGPATATVDLTVDTALSITVTMGASSASNAVVGNNYALSSRN